MLIQIVSHMILCVFCEESSEWRTLIWDCRLQSIIVVYKKWFNYIRCRSPLNVHYFAMFKCYDLQCFIKHRIESWCSLAASSVGLVWWCKQRKLDNELYRHLSWFTSRDNWENSTCMAKETEKGLKSEDWQRQNMSITLVCPTHLMKE